MPKIIFLEHNGTEHAVNAEIGESVMQAAINALVPGIIGECGGTCSCATCHGYLDAAWVGRVPLPSSNEAEMLQCVLEPMENSRLTCQLKVNQELDGIVIRLPVSQL